MAKNTQELAERFGGQTQNTPAQWMVQFKGAWKQAGSRLVSFTGNVETARRLYSAVVYSIQNNPRLMEASVETFLSACLQCAATGLMPGPYQEAALVPFAGKVTFVPQYQGLAKLLYESGFVKKIQTRVVWSGDEFQYTVGSGERIVHNPEWNEANRGFRLGVYCIVTNTNGGEEITYLTAAQVERVKAAAPGAKKADSPWNSTDPDRVDAMWKKTAIRRASKLLPKTPKLAAALDADGDEKETEAPKIPGLSDEMPDLDKSPSSPPNVTPIPPTGRGDGDGGESSQREINI